MSQEQQQDEYPETYLVIMSNGKGEYGCASVGAHNKEACIMGMHSRFPNAVLTVIQIK